MNDEWSAISSKRKKNRLRIWLLRKFLQGQKCFVLSSAFSSRSFCDLERAWFGCRFSVCTCVPALKHFSSVWNLTLSRPFQMLFFIKSSFNAYLCILQRLVNDIFRSLLVCWANLELNWMLNNLFISYFSLFLAFFLYLFNLFIKIFNDMNTFWRHFLMLAFFSWSGKFCITPWSSLLSYIDSIPSAPTEIAIGW